MLEDIVVNWSMSANSQVLVDLLQDCYSDFIFVENKVLMEDNTEVAIEQAVVRVILEIGWASISFTIDVSLSHFLGFDNKRSGEVLFDWSKSCTINPLLEVNCLKNLLLLGYIFSIIREVLFHEAFEFLLEYLPLDGSVSVFKNVLVNQFIHQLHSNKALDVVEELVSLLVWDYREGVIWSLISNIRVEGRV